MVSPVNENVDIVINNCDLTYIGIYQSELVPYNLVYINIYNYLSSMYKKRPSPNTMQLTIV